MRMTVLRTRLGALGLVATLGLAPIGCAGGPGAFAKGSGPLSKPDSVGAGRKYASGASQTGSGGFLTRIRGPRSTEEAREQLAEAEDLFRQEEYSAAKRRLSPLSRRGPDGVREDALFLLAECEFLEGELPEAQDAYARLLKEFPTTRHLPTAVQRTYDIAYFWLEDSRRNAVGQSPSRSVATRYVNFVDERYPVFDASGRAVEAIDAIQQYDPIGPLSDDALMMAAAHEFASEDYLQAATYYEQVVLDQPKCEHAFKALMLGGQSYLRNYEGPNYDSRDLRGAEKLLKAAATRVEPGDEESSEHVRRDLRVVQLEKARREFRTAEIFEWMRKPKSARFYYSIVLRDHPDTRWAKEAESAIARIDEQLANAKPSLFQRWFGKSDEEQTATP